VINKEDCDLCAFWMANQPALLAGWTHPGYASLADPLYGFAVKRVKTILF
jgi:hypothetical protein